MSRWRAGLVALLLAGCATQPKPLQGSFQALTAHQAVVGDHTGAMVRWGGRIIRTEPRQDRTCFEVVSTELDAAVAALIKDGVSVSVSAGNDSRLACNQSPARVPAAITVVATTETDVRADFSNYGSCLDLFAPGEDITSAYNGNNASVTSMSAP